MASNKVTEGKRFISYSKWGYIFLAPFIIVFIIFQLYPLIETFYYSFFEYYFVTSDFEFLGPNYAGFDNYKQLFQDGYIFDYLYNTLIMWVLGFVPQIIISLLFAYWFTNTRLNLKRTGIFKSIIYMPNLIMASAFAMLIYALFSDSATGPVNSILASMGLIDPNEPLRLLSTIWGTRGLVAFMNFMMWFGNTTILLMAAMMGLNYSLIEAAEIDGASSTQVFFKITLPLIRPVLVYVIITSLIGGLQMFDVPQVLTKNGAPVGTSKTIIMYLNDNLFSKNYGAAGAISALVFIIGAAFSLVVYYFFSRNSVDVKKKKGA